MSRLDAVANRVRLEIARFLAKRGAASAPEVAEAVGVHLNTARKHLAALVDTGAAERTSVRRHSRGRPVVRYTIKRGWAPRGEELLPMSQLLAAAARSVRDRQKLLNAAVEWGRGAGRSAMGAAEERLTSSLERLGFRAQVAGGELRLAGCPCPVVSPEDAACVCQLVDGAVDGVLEGTRLMATKRRHDPGRRECAMTLVSS